MVVLIDWLMFHIIDISAKSFSNTVDFIICWDEDCKVVMIMLLPTLSYSYCCRIGVVVESRKLIGRQVVGCNRLIRASMMMTLPMSYEKKR